jgi:hypothetical protein
MPTNGIRVIAVGLIAVDGSHDSLKGAAMKAGHVMLGALAAAVTSISAVERGCVLGDLPEEAEARVLEEVGVDD